MFAKRIGEVAGIAAAALAAVFVFVLFSACTEKGEEPEAASSAASAEAGNDLVAAYLAIHEALHQDSTQGVADQARLLGEAASALSRPQGSPGAAVAGRLSGQAETLAGAGDLVAVREAFKPVSESIIQLRNYVPEAGELVVVHCPMMNGNWVQRGTTVLNPYHGSEMLGCGQVIDGARGAEGTHDHEGHDHAGHDHAGHNH